MDRFHNVISRYHVMVFSLCSFFGSPVTRHGNEIQEIWKINACWHYDRAKVRAAQHAEQFEKSQSNYATDYFTL